MGDDYTIAGPVVSTAWPYLIPPYTPEELAAIVNGEPPVFELVEAPAGL